MTKKTRGKKLSYPVRSYTDHEVQEFIKLDRKETRRLRKTEEPSGYMIEALRESEEDRKAGRYKSFDNARDAIAWLNSSDKSWKK